MIRAQPHIYRVRTLTLGLFAVASLVLTDVARSDVINFTGNVATDFPASTGTTDIAGRPG